MKSLVAKTNKLIVLTLIAGFLLMPVAPVVLAEELAPSAPIEAAPVVSDIPAPENVAPVAPADSAASTPSDTPAPSDAPALADTCPSVAATSSDASVTSSDASVGTSSDPVVDSIVPVDNLDNQVINLPAKTGDSFDVLGEDSFTTKSESDPLDPVIIGDEEGSFSTLAGEINTPSNLAISEENPFGEEETNSGYDLSAEGQWQTLPGTIVEESTVSAEGNFSTTGAPDDNEDPAISGENNFVTANIPTEDNLTVSEEQNFITLNVPIETDPSISDENSFVTLNGGDDTDSAISEEGSFTTLDNPNNPDETVSEEMSFTTSDNPNNPDETVSEENSFTTESGSGPSGCVGSCGGGGGGGSISMPKAYRCEILLYKFIKLGVANDRREVIKLQAFLKVYEGFTNLKITGNYDLPTYNAVRNFQERYGKDILGPWKIDDPTGYVYITTRIAINNIFCGRDTTNNTDLRNEFYRVYEEATGETFSGATATYNNASLTDGGYYITPTSTEASSSVAIKKSWILASLSGLLGFVGDNLCWLLNLLLLLIILFLLWLLWLGERDGRNNDDSSFDGGIEGVDALGLPADKLGQGIDPFAETIVNGSLGMVGAVALEELMSEEDNAVLADLAEEEESLTPAANNDPDQEKLLAEDLTNS